MGMACHAVPTDLVLVIGRGIIGVVSSCGVTGLANSVPRLVSFIEGKVLRALLENRQV